jgi:hypothetical protein
MPTTLDVRPSPLAGRWYPADPRRLARSVDELLAAASLPGLPGRVVAVMAPHAGYAYSGAVAAHAFAALRGQQPELVAVISPMHYPYESPLLTTAHAAYSTPLGETPVDRAALARLDAGLQSRLGYGLEAVRQDPEHSLEIELPFLQRIFPAGFSLLPVMVRDPSPAVARALGEALAETLAEAAAGRRAVLVASTDLSHFFPRLLADRLDGEMLRQVEAFDPQGVLRIEEEGKGFACGRGALAAVLWAARLLGADKVVILRHANSGDVTGDYSQVVGYAAAAMLATQEA